MIVLFLIKVKVWSHMRTSPGWSFLLEHSNVQNFKNWLASKGAIFRIMRGCESQLRRSSSRNGTEGILHWVWSNRNSQNFEANSKIRQHLHSELMRMLLRSFQNSCLSELKARKRCFSWGLDGYWKSYCCVSLWLYQ